jgi:hypothetical protein
MNLIMMYITFIVSLFGIVSGLTVAIYYINKISGKKKMTRTEFNKGIILFAVTNFVLAAGIIIPRLIIIFIDSEPVTIPQIIMVSFCCLGVYPFLAGGTFILSFKGSVEKEE